MTTIKVSQEPPKADCTAQHPYLPGLWGGGKEAGSSELDQGAWLLPPCPRVSNVL